MTTSFSALKKARSSSFEKLNSQLTKMQSNGNSNDDDRFWKLEVDKAGNGFAKIRFLPVANDDLDVPFVRIWDHGFQGPGGWYIENSLTTLGKDDPVSEYNSKLWNSGVESDKEIARAQKRRLNFYANIYVVQDSANPENEGKVFLFKFGKKIFDKLNEAMNPKFEDETPVNPFDFWEGADFKLKAYNADSGYRSYDKSDFTSPGRLKTPDGEEMNDEQLEEIWNQQYKLKELIDPSNFKTYEELQARLYKVLALDGGAYAATNIAEDDAPSMDFKPNFGSSDGPKGEEDSAPEFSSTDFGSDDEDSLSFFKQLAEED